MKDSHQLWKGAKIPQGDSKSLQISTNIKWHKRTTKRGRGYVVINRSRPRRCPSLFPFVTLDPFTVCFQWICCVSSHLQMSYSVFGSSSTPLCHFWLPKKRWKPKLENVSAQISGLFTSYIQSMSLTRLPRSVHCSVVRRENRRFPSS